MNAPATESAVQTTPPMTIAATIPAVPLSPQATSMMLASMSVIMVIPLTGLEPTMAMAFAATVVKRKAMIATMSKPMIASQMLSTTPNAKKSKTAASVTMMPITTIFIEMSLCVLMTSASASDFLRRNSLVASPRADLITPKDLMMPMMPAVAMPPMPMWRA